MEEVETIKKAMIGDARSLEILIEKYYGSIYAFCCRRVGDESIGAEICQESFLRMVQNLPKYNERGYFKSWLFAIASNCCIDALRKHKQTAELSDMIVDNTQDFESGISNSILIKSALSQLPDFQAEAVILRYYHDFSIKDIAKAQHIPLATAKTRLHRSLKKLQKILGEDILLET